MDEVNQTLETPKGTPGVGRVAVIIPAYEPTDALATLVDDLGPLNFDPIIVIDDGSSAEGRAMIDSIVQSRPITLLRHRYNRGKGAALKTGFRHTLGLATPVLGVVTVDADGQHLLEDIRRVGDCLRRHPQAMTLGSRTFGRDVPWRSRLGNVLTTALFRLLYGIHIPDTQTGLRALPRSALEALLGIKSDHYEFEMDALGRHVAGGNPVVFEPIKTVYLNGNKSSHFNPFFDSLRIWFTLIRFTFSALVASALDLVLFAATFLATGSVPGAMVAGRLAGVLFNFGINRRLVFLYRGGLAQALSRYLLLVVALGSASYAMISLLISTLSASPLLAKVAAETLMFPLSFLVQQKLVFAVARKSTIETSAQ